MDALTTYASFDAASIAFRAHVGRERIDFYTGATGDRFCCALAVDELLAAEAVAGLKVGRLLLHGWQVRDIKERLLELRHHQARRRRPSVLAA